jgi:LysR family transcriptional regulator, hydrogen peroxide-inducible genes activator
MRPTLRQLEYIVAVADRGRVGAAADHLNVSQPSLSAQLSEVEADLGVLLFDRGRSGAKITPEGEDIVRRARLILRDHEDLRASAKGKGVFEGRLRLGVLPSIGPYLLPEVVRQLHVSHPSFRLFIREENTRDLDEGLRSGRLDMIISTPEDHPGTRQEVLFDEHFWVATALDHPLADKKTKVTLADLKGQIFLTLGARHRLSYIVSSLAGRAGGRVSDEYEGTSLDAIRLMAATGTGIAILPHIYATTEARRGTDVALHRLDAPDAKRRISLIQPLLPEPRPGSDALSGVLLKVAQALMAP